MSLFHLMFGREGSYKFYMLFFFSKALKYSYPLCAHGYRLSMIVLNVECPFHERLVTFV